MDLTLSQDEIDQLIRQRNEGRKLSRRRYYHRTTKPKKNRRIIAENYMKKAAISLARKKFIENIKIFGPASPINSGDFDAN